MMAYKKIETLTAHKHNMPRTYGRTCSSRTQTPALLTWVCCTLVVEKHSDCQRSTFPHSPGENVHSFCHEVVKVAGRNFSTSACLTWSNNATDTQFHYVKADLGQMGRGLVNPTGERLLLMVQPSNRPLTFWNDTEFYSCLLCLFQLIPTFAVSFNWNTMWWICKCLSSTELRYNRCLKNNPQTCQTC